MVAPDGTLTGAPWPEREQMLAQFDTLKTDAVEAELLTRIADHRDAARAIAGWGPREIVLTHRDGLLVFANGRFHEAPFRPRQLVGRSGRGDTCIASYVAKRLTAPPEEACLWAAVVTSLKMEAEGPLKKSAAEVEELFRTAYGRP